MPRRKSDMEIWIKNAETNELQPKKRGPNPKGTWVRGYKDPTGNFVEGPPPMPPKGMPGRPRKSEVVQSSASLGLNNVLAGNIKGISLGAPKGKPGRPRKSMAVKYAVSCASKSNAYDSSISREIEKIVQRELDKRLKTAKIAAIDAFSRALEV